MRQSLLWSDYETHKGASGDRAALRRVRSDVQWAMVIYFDHPQAHEDDAERASCVCSVSSTLATFFAGILNWC